MHKTTVTYNNRKYVHKTFSERIKYLINGPLYDIFIALLLFQLNTCISVISASKHILILPNFLLVFIVSKFLHVINYFSWAWVGNKSYSGQLLSQGTYISRVYCSLGLDRCIYLKSIKFICTLPNDLKKVIIGLDKMSTVFFSIYTIHVPLLGWYNCIFSYNI